MPPIYFSTARSVKFLWGDTYEETHRQALEALLADLEDFQEPKARRRPRSWEDASTNAERNLNELQYLAPCVSL